MKVKKEIIINLQAIPILDLTTSWIEISSVLDAQADLVVNQVKLVQFATYPLPHKVAENKTMMYIILKAPEILKKTKYLKVYIKLIILSWIILE